MRFIIKVEVYPFDVLVSIGNHAEPISSYIERTFKYSLNDEEIKGLIMNGNGKCTQFRNGAVVIQLKEKPTNPFALGIMAHESLHAVNFILSKTGVRYDDNNDEPYTYLLQFIVTKIMRKFAK